MAKKSKKLSPDQIKEIESTIAKYFYARCIQKVFATDDENEYNIARNEFIKEYVDLIFNLYKDGNKEECQIIYNTPSKELLPIQEQCIKSIVIDNEEGARTTYKRIDDFLNVLRGHLTYRARHEDIEKGLYDCIYGRDLKVIVDDTINNKISWTGTPGEFGAILKELIDKNYILKVKDLKTTVEMLYKVFEVRNEDGNTVDAKYLYKCFGEKMKKYNFKNELVIPYSDNFNKKK